MHTSRLLLLACLIVGLTIPAQALCPPGMSPERCKNISGGFKKSLIVELLQRKNLNLHELDDRTLKRALNLLLDDERNNEEAGHDVTLEEKERNEKEHARSDARLRELLSDILRED